MVAVPAEQATTVTKAYLAEFILKAAAGGLTSYEDLITAAVAQFHAHVKAVKPRHIVWAVARLTGPAAFDKVGRFAPMRLGPVDRWRSRPQHHSGLVHLAARGTSAGHSQRVHACGWPPRAHACREPTQCAEPGNAKFAPRDPSRRKDAEALSWSSAHPTSLAFRPALFLPRPRAF